MGIRKGLLLGGIGGKVLFGSFVRVGGLGLCVFLLALGFK